MRERTETADWAATTLGPASTWPESLRTAANIVLDSAFPSILWWARDLVQIYNDAYVPLIREKHPAALGQRAVACFPEVWDEIRPLLEAVMESGTSFFFEDLRLDLVRNGFPEECYFTFSYSPIRAEDGSTGGVLCTVYETTAKVIGARRFLCLRELQARAFDARTLEDACLIAAQTLERNPDDIPFTRIIAPGDDGLRLVAASGLELDAGTERTLIDAARAAAGNPIAVDIPRAGDGVARAFAQPILDAESERPNAVLITGLSPRLVEGNEYRAFLRILAGQLSSVIANAKAQHAERERVRRLAELDEAKTTFFNNVSHEFRTPLTLMLGPLVELQHNKELQSPHAREQVDAVHRNTLRLLKLVNTLLEFSRLQAGRTEGTFRPTNLAEVTVDLASTFRSAVEAGGLHLVIDTPALPELVYVDRTMWERIVLNLLSNALKFTFHGEVRVELGVSGDPAFAELRVSDTGTGIPADELPHLFERFRRVRGAQARTNEGSGIGLALVHELVDLHGGTIDVHSELGRGTTFVVRVPFGSEHLPAEQLAPAAAVRPATEVVDQYLQEAHGWMGDGITNTERRSGSPRVVIADDNADLRSYIARILAEQFDVETTADGAAALAALDREPADLVITDAMMPVMDGFELVRRIRDDERLSQVPIIMLSARAGGESAIEGLRSGADDYLVKPFSADELRARVEAHVAMSRLRSGDGAGTTASGRFLVEATAELTSSLDVNTTVAKVLELAVPALGDFVVVRLASETGRTVHGDRAVHVVPEKRRMLDDLMRRYRGVDARVGVAHTVLRSGASMFTPVVTDEVLEARTKDRGLLEIQRAIGIKSIMVVPMIARGEPLGTISFGRSEREDPYELRDLALVEEFTRRVASALENAMLFERERRVAQRFQDAAMPRTLPALQSLAITSHYTPGQSEALVGGDWYDALKLPDGRVMISIGDVAGSGLEAAVTMGHVRQVMRGVVHVDSDPVAVLSAVDKTLRAEYPDRLVTAFIGVIDAEANTLTYGSAGHPAAFVRAADGSVTALDVVGLPLGLRGLDEPEAVTVSLPEDALLVLYTDGLVEATRDYLAGESRLRALLEEDAILTVSDPARLLYEQLLPGGAQDDVAILAVRILPLAASLAVR